MAVPTVKLSGKAKTGIVLPGMMTTLSQLPTDVKLGRVAPPMKPEVARIEEFFDESQMASPPPPSINRRAKAAKSLARMYLNNRYGCCVISGKAHNVGLWSANDDDSPGEIEATDEEILSQYQGICGRGDNGCMIYRVLDVMKSRGFIAGGKQYKIDGYISADHRNQTLVKVCQYIFGATTIGIDLPRDWTNSDVWDVTNSRSVGGHDVSPIDYDDKGVYVSSWGRIYLMTWAAFTSTRWVDEFYVMLAPLWYGDNRLAPSGFNVEKMQEALRKIDAGTVPDIEPVTPPSPPVPDPPPVGPPVNPPPPTNQGQLVLDLDSKTLFAPPGWKVSGGR